MDIESTTQLNKADFFSHWGIFLKALPSNSKSKMINVTRSIKNIGQDDPSRVIHSIKMGITLTLVSLLYYLRPLYDGFGLAGMYAVLAVVTVFEFTVAATLNKGLNGGCATLLAGALGFGGQHLAIVFGERGEPFVLGTLIFILAAGSTFFIFFPKIKERYDYGVVTKMSSESSNALKAMSSSIKTMADPLAAKCHIDNSKTVIEDLKIALETVSLEQGELLARIRVAAVATILKAITMSVEKIYESVSELSHLAHFKSTEPNVSPEKPVVMDIENADHIEIIIQQNSAEEENAPSPKSSQCLQL